MRGSSSKSPNIDPDTVAPSGTCATYDVRDIDKSIEQLHRTLKPSLIEQIVKIQEHETPNEKFYEWARHLNCLLRPGKRHRRNVRRTEINIFANNDFVAVSYPWTPSEYEDDEKGGYQVQQLNGDGFAPCTVRDTVMKRVIKYLHQEDIPAFWIDAECIDQDDESEKKMAMNSMDLVYKLSHHPLALLSVPIKKQSEIDILSKLMAGKLVKYQIATETLVLKPGGQRIASDLVKLLLRITSDDWYLRAWTFQEEYRGSKMSLMIPHADGLVKHKRLGHISGELVVSSSDLRYRSTRFCLAYMRFLVGCHDVGSLPDVQDCYKILDRAQSYKAMNQYGAMIGDKSKGKAMSSKVFDDINRREIKKEADFIPIAANCCNYTRRFELESLRREAFSISASVLALFFLNGEIFHYESDTAKERSISKVNVFEFLAGHAFSEFQPPPAGMPALTFLKHARLPSVTLIPDGVQTVGHLWQVQQVLDDKSRRQILGDKRRYARQSSYRDNEEDSTCETLYKLSETLSQYKKTGHLARCLKRYVEGYLDPNGSEYMSAMAQALTHAIHTDKTIGIASVVRGRRIHSYPSGLFILDDGIPSALFSAWEQGVSASGYYNSSRDKYASLAVSVSGPDDALPLLSAQSWRNGLLFFAGMEAWKSDVVFRWPALLM